MKKDIILFDLDGTLINSYRGIRYCVEYALAETGFQVAEEDFPLFIGPPLTDSFMKYAGMNEEEAAAAVAAYRKRYIPEGIHMYDLYPGVEETLAGLYERGKRIGLATSKPEPMAEQILREQGLDGYFEVIGGSIHDRDRGRKAEVLSYVLGRFQQPSPVTTVLIGDTIFDLEGARSVGMDCILVTYGFGAETTVRQADASVDRLPEILDIIC
ncbi:MAG: HAD hydrolase-like protein [Eubacteriales bacterium]|nr:HAD hydrolase-like protein [Eubacteriales bacterium]